MRRPDHQMASLSIVCVLVVCFAVSAGAEDPPVDFQMIRVSPGLSLHKEMFMLPVTFSSEYNGAQTETVFQLSAKHRLLGSGFYFGYTQISFWQAYDHKNSAPFRETNYNPELFYRWKRFGLWGGQVGADIGFEHESNGQRVGLSRSWNLLYISGYYWRSNMLLHLKLRYRIPEDEKETPDAAVGDDNPDITDYLGYSDLTVMFRLPRNHLLRLKLRGNIGKGRGGVVLTYSLPVPKSEQSFFVVRLSHGYGESLVDYKRSLDRIGVGIMFRR